MGPEPNELTDIYERNRWHTFLLFLAALAAFIVYRAVRLYEDHVERTARQTLRVLKAE